MVLTSHSDAEFHNESKGRSQAGDDIFLAEDEPVPRWNGLILTIAQVIKNFMSSAAEAELGTIFIKAKELVPIHQTMIDMGWPQLPIPIQTDNYSAAGVANKSIIARKTNSMELRLH